MSDRNVSNTDHTSKSTNATLVSGQSVVIKRTNNNNESPTSTSTSTSIRNIEPKNNIVSSTSTSILSSSKRHDYYGKSTLNLDLRLNIGWAWPSNIGLKVLVEVEVEVDVELKKKLLTANAVVNHAAVHAHTGAQVSACVSLVKLCQSLWLPVCGGQPRALDPGTDKKRALSLLPVAPVPPTHPPTLSKKMAVT